MVNHECSFKLFPDGLNSKSNSLQEDPSALKYNSSNQYTPPLAACMGALGEEVVIRNSFSLSQLPPNSKKIKKKKRQCPLYSAIAWLLNGGAKGKFYFSIQNNNEIKFHCLKKKIMFSLFITSFKNRK